MKNCFAIWSIIWKNKRSLIITLTLINIGLLFLYASIYPSMAAQSASLNQVIASLPETMLKAFNINTSLNLGLEGLVVSKQFALMLPIMMLILVNGLAGEAIAEEIDRGSILLYLSQPISRAQYYWSKFGFGAIAIVVFSVLSILTTVPIAKLFNLEVTTSHFAVMTGSTILFGLATYAIAFAVSAYFSDSKQVTLISTGIFLWSYLASVLSQLVEKLASLKYLSLLYYFGPTDTFVQYSIPLFIFITIAMGVVGALIFRNRDISIR